MGPPRALENQSGPCQLLQFRINSAAVGRTTISKRLHNCSDTHHGATKSFYLQCRGSRRRGTKPASARSLPLPAMAQPLQSSARRPDREGDMSRSKLALITMMILSMGFVLYPQDSAHAARYCAQVRGTTVGGQPDCSFSTMDACRARVKHRGGGHCYRLTHPS